MAVIKTKFGQMPDGREISLYQMTNQKGVQASVTDLGAIWVGLLAPDREGKFSDVLLGYDDASGYLKNGPHFGSVVGRIANRTAKARFSLHGKTYALTVNNGENNLHSGLDYYDKRLWDARIDEERNAVEFSLFSPDGDQGFPGNLRLSVTYELTEDSMVSITYRTVCDQDTPLNLTNHAYFNLAGHDGGLVLSQKARILADFYTPSAADSIPTGEVLKTAGTPMDFGSFKTMGKEIDAEFDQLLQAGGYDHNWCLKHERGVFSLAAEAKDETSGRHLSVYTDQPGVQFYTANGLKEENGKNGAAYGPREAFCFETQNWPDAVNQPHFPSPVLKAGEEFVSRTGYRFDTEDEAE